MDSPTNMDDAGAGAHWRDERATLNAAAGPSTARPEARPSSSAMLSADPSDILGDSGLTMNVSTRKRRRFSMPTRTPSFAGHETLTAYLDLLHDHLPPSMTLTLSNLRNALLGYLTEAETAVRQDLAVEGTDVSASSESEMSEVMPTRATATSTNAGMAYGLRQRGAALQRTLSGNLPSRGFPSREALLAHLAAIKEDVAASLPEMPSISSLPTPSLPIPSVTSFLQDLPTRLSFLQEHLPATGQPDKEKVVKLVRSLLPSEDWAGWERLGWDTNDEDDSGIIPDSEDEEPEYLFPNKTPRAAMKRQESYAAKTRSRSASLSMVALRKSRSLQEVRDAASQAAVLAGDISAPGVGFEGEEGDDEEILLLQEKIGAPQVGPTTQEALEKSQHGKVLITYDDLPPWAQNNEFIMTGYRFIPLHAKTGPIPLLHSILHWHNETVNLHSHLIPALILSFVIIPYTLIYTPLRDPALLDVLTLLAFLLAAVSCLLSSAGWHLLSGCSKRSLFEWGACVDYVGISWLISCSIHTVYYNGFYCQGRTLLLYTLSTLTSAILGSIMPFRRWFNERKYKSWRIAFFLGICFTALAPLSHLAYVHGFNQMLAFSYPIYPSIIAYVTGLLFYAFHFPESKWPGRFDYFGASHNLWHAFIILAIYLHYAGTLTIFNQRHAFSCALESAGPPMSSYFKGWQTGAWHFGWR